MKIDILLTIIIKSICNLSTKNSTKLFEFIKIFFILMISSVSKASSVELESKIDNSAYIMQVLLGLCMVLILIFITAWIVKKLGSGSLVSNTQMKIIGSLALGTRERIVMIEVGGQQLLLGVAPGRVSTLHVFQSPVIDTSSDFEASEFGKKIREIMNKGRVK